MAHSIKSHIVQAYAYLVRFYAPGDRIFLMGFSRGAFAARAVLGMLTKVGLLRRGNEHMTDLAFQCYSTWEYDCGVKAQELTMLVDEFKRTFSLAGVPVHFMGLWDSVNSVGLLKDRFFPFTLRVSNVDHVRHAVSIDERRAKFKQCLFAPSVHSPSFFDYDSIGDEGRDNVRRHLEPTLRPLGSPSGSSLDETAIEYFRPRKDLIEKWFCGDHCDIGGGWERDATGGRLSDVSLQWMVSEAYFLGARMKKEELRCLMTRGPLENVLACTHDVLLFTWPAWILQLWNMLGFPTSQDPCRDPRPLYRTVLWWIAEILPLGTNIKDHQGNWRSYYVPNLGRPRKIPDNSDFHWSVHWRLMNDSTYRPKNLPFNPEDITQVQAVDELVALRKAAGLNNCDLSQEILLF